MSCTSSITKNVHLLTLVSLSRMAASGPVSSVGESTYGPEETLRPKVPAKAEQRSACQEPNPRGGKNEQFSGSLTFLSNENRDKAPKGTHPKLISHTQLRNEVKAIYGRLSMIETACTTFEWQIANNERSTELYPTLEEDQWNALIDMHHILLHEHRFFFGNGASFCFVCVSTCCRKVWGFCKSVEL